MFLAWCQKCLAYSNHIDESFSVFFNVLSDCLNYWMCFPVTTTVSVSGLNKEGIYLYRIILLILVFCKERTQSDSNWICGDLVSLSSCKQPGGISHHNSHTASLWAINTIIKCFPVGIPSVLIIHWLYFLRTFLLIFFFFFFGILIMIIS